jgi:hypothetical protein
VGGNDKSASHATRVAGTQNFKVKYAPAFQTVTMVETHPGRVKSMTPKQVDSLSLLAQLEPIRAAELRFTSRRERQPGRERQWSSYEESVTRRTQSGGHWPGSQHSGLLVVILAKYI